MGLGRRVVSVENVEGWVFNRMAHVYDARPGYPAALLDAIATHAAEVGTRVADLGAGIGHMTLPLAARGFEMTAVEPAIAMLDRLRHSATARNLVVSALHATAESIPVPPDSYDAVLIADALHFLDAERAGLEVARVLRPDGVLMIVTSELGTTPFMARLIEEMEQAAPRRPRETRAAATQLSALAGATLDTEQSFDEHVPVDHDQLERILRSISFIGPAMNPERFARFSERVRAIRLAPVWSRTFTLRVGRCRRGGVQSGR